MSRRKKSLRKRVLGSPLLLWPLVIFVSLTLRLIYLTNRKSFHWPDPLKPYATGEKQGIFCFWHGRMMAQLFIAPPKRRMMVFSSPSRDGAVASMLCRSFGIGTVFGSRSRGAASAASATRALLQAAMAGCNISITPDGPRGPYQQAAPGAAYLASKAGFPLVPVAFAASRNKRLRSWDRFMIFKPFGHIHYVVATPIHVPARANESMIQAITQQLQQTLIAVADQADALAGLRA